MHSSGVVNTPLLVGRELKSLTPAELEDLLTLAGIKIADIDEPSPNELTLKAGEIRLHPKYNIIYQPGDRPDVTDSIQVTVWSGQEGECEPDTRHVEICTGEVIDYWGGQYEAVAVVKWFLDHGWKWNESNFHKVVGRFLAKVFSSKITAKITESVIDAKPSESA